ncbi:response regulator [Colwellia sp. C1TZA3]|uniref:response regulator n=1 Tax=Colwellia sp. C1TZA3 TaxID=2508879 RepID=UPI00174C4DD5|nr:response regulator [Colwellia sp. C1TZA3]
MIDFQGYNFVKEQQEVSSLVKIFVVKNDKEQQFLVKRLKKTTNNQALVRFKSCLALQDQLPIKQLVAPLEIYDEAQYCYALLPFPPHTKSLTDLSLTPLSLANKLQISINICELYAQLHQLGFIVNNICPDHIYIDENFQPLLYDLSFATKISALHKKTTNSNVERPYLATLAPEASGRMNHAIEVYSDFYSIGASLFNLFTGRLPFIYADEMELVHAHIAKKPKLANQYNTDVPAAVAKILAQLLEKEPSQRYQTAVGLKADFIHCATDLKKFAKVREFTLGKQDVSNKLIFSAAIFGRKQEQDILLQAFNAVEQDKSSKICLISGHSGSGKSRLIKELHRPIIEKKGYCVQGKYEQYKKNVPYFALIQAMSELVEQLLGESEKSLSNWKKVLLTALQGNGQLLIEQVPELALILGIQPTLAELPAAETRNRFNATLVNFLQAFGQQNSVVTIFIDDMQWADIASIQLLQYLVKAKYSTNLLLIIAFRDNEIIATQPLNLLLEAIKQTQAFHTQINLLALDARAITEFIAASLSLKPEKTQHLVKIVIEKTAGNPFYIKEFIKSLNEQGILTRNKQNHWHWDEQLTHKLTATDNVVEIMALRLTHVSKAGQNILYHAACIGSVIPVKLLTQVLGVTNQELEQALRPLITDGLIIAYSQNQSMEALEQIKFAHDKIQQSAYLLTNPVAKALIHYKVAQYFISAIYTKTPENSATEENVFDYIEHLNLASSLYIEQGNEKLLAHFNDIAGEKSLEINDYNSALYYFEQAEDYLGKLYWQQEYALSVRITLGKANALYFLQDYGQGNLHFQQHFALINDVIAQARFAKIQVLSLIAQNQMQKALDLGIATLAGIAITLPQADQSLNYLAIEQYYKPEKITDLIHLPAMTDKRQLLALDILNAIQTPAYLLSPVAYMRIAYTALELCLTAGLSALSAKVFVSHGLLLCGAFSRFKAGSDFAALAKKVNLQYPSEPIYVEVEFIYNVSITHWTSPLSETLKPLEKNFYQGIGCGSVEYAFNSALLHSMHSLFSGKELSICKKMMARYAELMQSKKQHYQQVIMQVWQQLINNFQDENTDIKNLQGEYFNEKLQLPTLIETKNINTLFSYHLALMIQAYLFNNIAQAHAQMLLAQPYLHAVVSLYHFGEFHFYAALICAQHCHNQAAEPQENHYHENIVQINTSLDLITQWANNSPENYRHKAKLIQAELQCLLEDSAAWQNYDQAIILAKQHLAHHHVALANELAGNYWLAANKKSLATEYYQQAFNGYQIWGAKHKAQQLLTLRQSLLIAQRHDRDNLPSDKQHNNAQELDLTSVLKASETLSGEVDLSAFLHRMMVIIIENAGAQNGALLLQSDGILNIEIALSRDGMANTQQQLLPYSIINLVSRTLKAQVLTHISAQEQFLSDPYFEDHQPKSILCFPSIVKGNLQGIVYLEHYDVEGVFSNERVNVLQLLANQTAISFDNAKLYQLIVNYSRNLEDQIFQRTKELAAEKIKAEQASQAKSNFLANMSHEIRTPMNAVIGLSQLALRTELSVTQQDYLDKIQDSSKSLLGLINDILDFSKIEAEKLTLEHIEFSLDDMLQRVVNVCTYKVHEKGLEFVIDIAPDVPKIIKGDPLRLQQVIVNLANNALKFTHAGSIHICIEKHSENSQTTCLKFSVHDTGIGMSQQQQQGLFQSFTQADDSVTRKYGGTGLGLAISKQLAELMHGEISLKSELNVGSTFSFTASFEHAQPALDIVPTINRQVLPNLKVLVADDNDIARKVLIEALAYNKITADGVKDGAQAVAAVLSAQQNNTPYDMVMMDWKMPKMDGIQAAKHIQAQTQKKLPHILMISAFDKDEAKTLAINTGIEQFIEKPINPSTLTNIIIELLNKESEHIIVDNVQPELIVPNLSAYSVLLVEDNMINQQVAKEFLADTKITIECAENGLIALEKLATHAFDLVLMDIQMPEMDGLTATKEIRQTLTLQDLPVIAMTAHAMKGDIEKSIAAGMNLHLTKPIDPELLYQTLRQYLVKPDATLQHKPASSAQLSDSQQKLAKFRQTTILSVDDALKNLQGKESLYTELIDDFCLNYQVLAPAMVQFYNLKQTEVLYRSAHSLKSTAQYIGAYELAASANALENEIHHQGPYIELKLNQVVTDLDLIIKQLNNIYHPLTLTNNDQQLNSKKVEKIIAKLKPCLISANIQAQDISQQLMVLGYETPYHQHIANIEKLVNNFDFDEALTALLALEQKISNAK